MQKNDDENVTELSSAIRPALTSNVSTKHIVHDHFSSETKEEKKSFYREVIDFFVNAIEYEKRADGSDGSIKSYHNEFAITVGWLLPRRGSVFTLTEQIVVLGISVAICCLLAYGSCINQNNADYCIALPDASTQYLTLTTLCSFVVAFFANSVLDRWWNIRKFVLGITGAGSEVIIMFAGVLTSDVKDADSPEKKRALRVEKERLMNQLIGYLVLTLRLLFNSARGLTDFSDLVERRLISQSDHDYFVQINATSLHVCAVMLNCIQEAGRKGLLGQDHGVSEANMQLLQNSILNVRMNAANVKLFIDVQIPYPFIQIIASVVYMFIIQLTIVCSSFIAQGLAEQSSSSITTGVLTIVLYNFVLLGLLRLFEVLSNPLGDDAADFPGDTYMANFENDLKSVAKNTFALIDTGVAGLPSSVRMI